ncbi:hypothetical protein [Aureispira sp. CCB-E]|uniref:hypothetical protein n=1 Tax=Aureispira sp. CCB-E TaxID=3051121 RepID=UPI002868B4AB|nr:hypothetical protein [Aureispira sp. CCB-E]WMX16539.1 hypothetical protein QP953_09185 [Aureispira sp. CCB-E]
MPNKHKQTFRQFCEKGLSTEQFNSLYELPNWTKYSITLALNRPQIMPFELLLDIAKEIHAAPLDLAINYECSIDRMTARQYFSLLD